ncbi:hypothetical protein AKO1_015281 [Acrasis kona]|uniref:Uncharacterized protein n=1 Tax=Acrasis kona TaxID=1008807 RepID=A0AAW2ZFJ3_9EUKA
MIKNFDYRKDVLNKILNRNTTTEKHCQLIKIFNSLVDENKRLKESSTEKNRDVTKSFHPYMKIVDDVQDINAYLGQDSISEIDDDNVSIRSDASNAKMEEFTFNERKKLMDGMVQVMRDKDKNIEEMLQLTNILQATYEELKQKTDKCEYLESANEKLEQEVEHYKQEGNFFFIEIKRRDEAIANMDEDNADLVKRLENLMHENNKLQQQVDDINTLAHTFKTMVQEQHVHNQEQLSKIYELYENEKNTRMKLEATMRERFNLNVVFSQPSTPPKRPNVLHIKHQNDVDVTPTPNSSIIQDFHSLRKVRAHSNCINSTCYSKDGSLLASCGDDGYVRVWDTNNNYVQLQAFQSEKKERFTKVSIESNFVMAACDDKNAYIWSIGGQGRLTRVLKGHDSFVRAATFVSNGGHIPTQAVTGSHDRTVKIWDLHSGTTIKTFLCLSLVYDLTTPHCSNISASSHADMQIRVWDHRSQKTASILPTTHKNSITSVSFHESDSNILLTNSRDSSLRVIDLRVNREMITLSHEKYMNGGPLCKAKMNGNGLVVVGSTDQFFGGPILFDIKRDDARLLHLSSNSWNLLPILNTISSTVGTPTLDSTTKVMNGVDWNPKSKLGLEFVASAECDLYFYTNHV